MTDSPFIMLTSLASTGPQLTRYNPPGQPVIYYRPERYHLIVSRMLDALRKQKISVEGEPGIQPLIHFNILATDDWTVALLRAWATVSDVLSFYQERIINEGYLRTATERRSVLELVRAVGYELAPAVSATTYLAFAVQDDTPGQLVPVPSSTAVQSIPTAFSSHNAIQDIIQGQASPVPNLPVIFETTGDLMADASLNACKPSLTLGLPWPPKGNKPRTLRLAGSSLGLNTGDALLILGQPKSESVLPAWELLLLNKVESRAKDGLTSVQWDQTYGTVPESGIFSPTVYALRRKPVLFPYVAGPVFRDTQLGWAPTNIGLPPKTVQAAAADVEGRLFVGIDQAVYVSLDRGDTWQPVGSGLPAKDVHAIAVDGSGAVAVGSDDSAVYVSRDGGDNWTPLSGPGEVEIPTGWRRFVETVRYKLPKTNIRSLLFSQSRETELLAGSDDGVFGYDARQDSWISMNQHFPNLDKKKGTATLAVHALAASDGGKRPLAGTDNGVFPVESLFRGPANSIYLALLLLLMPGALNALIPNFLQGMIPQIADFLHKYIPQITQPIPLVAILVLLIWLQPFRQKWIGLLLVIVLFVIETVLGVRQDRVRDLYIVAQNLIGIFMGWNIFQDGLSRLPGLVKKYIPQIVPKDQPVPVHALLVVGAAVYAGTDHGVYRLNRLNLWTRFLHWLRQILFGAQPEPWTVLPGWPDDPADQVVNTLALDGQGRLLAGTQAGHLYVRQPGATQKWVSESEVPLKSIQAIVKNSNDLFTAGEPQDAPQEVRWAPAQLEAGSVDVDALTLGIRAGSFAAAVDGEHSAAFIVTGVVEQASHDAKKPGPMTRLTVKEKEPLSVFNRASTRFFCQSEPLTLFDDQFQPHPVQGDQIVLSGQLTGLQPGRFMLVSGTTLGGVQRSEPVIVKTVTLAERATIVQFETNLTSAYDRNSVNVYGNIAPAVQGQTIRQENLGESDGTIPSQRFKLHSPLAYEPAGANDYKTTLTVMVNKIVWTQVPSLWGRPADGRVFMVRRNGQGQTLIIFGDGQQGARLPTSQERLTATYRSGGGEEGNVPANSLVLLQSHLPRLKSVTNPGAAQGGQPVEATGHGRERAPQRLRALGRIVTLKDYGDFAASFPGVSQAAVHPVPEDAPPYLLEIAIVPRYLSGFDESQRDPLLDKLTAAIDQSRSTATLACRLRLFKPVTFDLGLTLYPSQEIRQEQDWVDHLQQAVGDQLRSAFNLNERSLGQAVTETEIMQIAQSVRGVTAVSLTRLRRHVPDASTTGLTPPDAVLPANWDEVLLLHEAGLEMEVAL